MFGYYVSIVKCDGGALMIDVSSFFGETIYRHIHYPQCSHVWVSIAGYRISFCVQLFQKGNNITGDVGLSVSYGFFIADLESEKITNPSVESITCGSCWYNIRASLIAMSSLVKFEVIMPVCVNFVFVVITIWEEEDSGISIAEGSV
ncbi:hypothetical protein TNCV_4847291 [Trichonephila clavipes]|nr:hypothetical protein TNCV_4847291 [Trichonephila clavipes]